MGSLLTLDGSHGEGGGQLLRSALALATLQGRPFRMTRIRAGRSRPGLRPQHLAAVRAMAQLSGGRAEGAALDSQELIFWPGASITSGEQRVDVSALGGQPSAGSVCLILQTMLLPLALRGDGPALVTLVGGTHVRWSPCYHYMADVYLPVLARIGIHCRLELGAWGWYPQGGGEMVAHIAPAEEEALQGLTLTRRGKLVEVWGLSAASNLPEHIIERQASQLRSRLHSRHIKAEIREADAPARGKGTMAFLLAQYEEIAAGFTGYGRLRYPAERVSDDAFAEFDAYRQSGAPVDPHLADQILLPLALARGSSTYRTSEVTPHLLSIAWLTQQFLSRRILVQGEPGEPGQVVIA